MHTAHQDMLFPLATISWRVMPTMLSAAVKKHADNALGNEADGSGT